MKVRNSQRTGQVTETQDGWIYWNRNAWNDVAWNECLEIKARRNLVMQRTRKGSLILNILNTLWQSLSHYIPVTFCCPHSWDRDHVLFSSPNPLHLAKALVCRALVAQKIKNPHAMQETWVWSRFHLGWEDPLEKEIITYSKILAWRIPQTEEPGRLQSLGVTKSGIQPLS